MALSELLARTAEDGYAGIFSNFYAQSWALADLVLLSPAYAPRFPQFVAALSGGADSRDAFQRVYGKSLDEVADDLRQRNRRRVRIPLEGAMPDSVAITASEVPPVQARLMIAEVVMLTGDLNRAAAMYRALESEAPDNGEIALAMGTLELRQGHTDAAREHWKRAISQGTTDAVLCFRFASLASLAGEPADEIRPALERAIELKPDFDDARYSMALLESNAGRHEIAVEQLRAMRQIAPGRAFAYWCALADSLTQLGRRAEAKAAALKAGDHAIDESERRHAADLAHVAETDLAVRMTRDSQGQARMVTTRIPHGVEDFNPFIEPGDAMARVEGALRDVDCSEPVLRIAVESSGELVKLAIRGLDRVQIRNGPGEFTCGPQGGAHVKVDYAKGKTEGLAGDVRGLEFR